MKVQFYLARPMVKNEKGRDVLNPSDTGIVANIHLRGKLMRIGTGVSASPKYWNPKNHRAKITPAYRQGSSINTLLDKIKGEIETVYYDYKREHNAEPSPATFKKLIDTTLGRSKETKLNLFEYFQDFIDRTNTGQRRNAKGQIIKPSKAYKVTLNNLKAFAGNKPLDFDNIDLDFYQDYLKFLQKKKLSENTIGRDIKNLKSVLNDATERGQNTNLAFRSKRFTKPVEEVENIALGESELQELQALDLSTIPHLDRTRDLFLIGCYTGLRYSDFSRLTTEHIKGGFIEIKQQKTGKPVAIPVHPIVKQIIEKYGNTLPTGISNQKTNDYLKEVCQRVPSLCEQTSKTGTKGGLQITKNYQKWEIISTHTARRTFATNAYLQGIPTVTIMAVTGHKTEKAFLKYIKVTSREHARIMASHWERNKMKIAK